MSTTIRPEISKKKTYWIEKHRYYELKHFCLQYSLWKKAYSEIDGLSRPCTAVDAVRSSTATVSPTEKFADEMLFYSERMSMIENSAKSADSELSDYILKAVTEGRSYEYLKAKLEIPCCRDVYYELYRKFFWILSHARK